MKNKKVVKTISIILILAGLSSVSYGSIRYNLRDKEESSITKNNSDNNDNNTSSPEEIKKAVINIIGEEIDITDDRVTNAYDKILLTYELNDTIYKKEKQTYETLNSKTVMNIIANQIDDISLFIPEKIGDNPSQGQYIYKLNESVIKDYMKKTFGSVEFDFNKYNQENGLLTPTGDTGGPISIQIKKTMVNENNETLPETRTLHCKKYQDGIYYFSEFRGGGTTSEILYNNILKASIDNEYLHIYEEEFKVKYKDKKYVVYLDNETTDETIVLNYSPNSFAITQSEEEIRTSIGDKINIYHHTFKKDENGNYYWVSTEQLKR